MLDLNLSGKRALVCGASKGIGRACAKELADLGCEIIALARDETALRDLISSLPTKQQHSYLSLDLSDFSNLQQAIRDEISQRGTINILINNAGGPAPGPIAEATDAQFEAAFKIHLRASALLASCVIPGMKIKQFGRIINIVSSSVKSPINDLGVSNTVRWAVAAWAKTLSYEVAKFGITVNSVLPGSIETGRLVSLMQGQADKRKIEMEVIRQEMIAQIPAGRIGSPEEVARVIAFLSTPAASYINGIAIPVDGGRTKVL
jgi:3-oxoacyl-[acyl-carrier protein] reductase